MKLILCRQVPGLQSRVSKHKKRTGSDVQNRTRLTPAERIIAQRAQRAEVGAGNQEEDHHQRQQQLHPGSVQQLRKAQRASHPQADSNQRSHPHSVVDLMPLPGLPETVNPPGSQQPLPAPAPRAQAEADNQDVVHRQDQPPLPLQPARQALSSTSNTGGEEHEPITSKRRVRLVCSLSLTILTTFEATGT